MSFRDTWVWKAAKHHSLDPSRRAIARVTHRHCVPLTWCVGHNWGDALSPVLVGLLSGKRVVHVDGMHHHRFLAIGSILGTANERAEVWGSGFIREYERLAAHPAAVHAVRGPLSRHSLLEQGVDCPEIYGDPAQLFPLFFNPAVGKRYDVGIIPHYIDEGHPWVERHRRDPRILVIDIESGVNEFVRAVKSCDLVLSSSLHGLICADAYGVPNARIRLSGDILGGDFKFRDYGLAVGAGDSECISVDGSTRMTAAVTRVRARTISFDLRRLLLACPFLADDVRERLLASLSSNPESLENNYEHHGSATRRDAASDPGLR